MDLIERLSGISLFMNLGKESLEALCETAELRSLPSGDRIIQFGEKGQVFGIVLEGDVEISRMTPAGTREVLKVLHAGEFFGEMSLMTGEPTTADVVAAGPVQVLLIPHYSMQAVIAAEPTLAATLAMTISRRLIARDKSIQEQEHLRQARLAQTDPYSLDRFPLPQGGKVLTINCGSSSLKYRLFDSLDPHGGMHGLVERIGLPEPRHIFEQAGEKVEEKVAGDGFAPAFDAMLKALGGEEALDGIRAVGHRVVHGGVHYDHAVVIDDKVLETVRSLTALAPLHIPANIAGIETAKEKLPGTPHVAVFDTAFHRTLPRHAKVYGLPIQFFEKDHVQRFGFHGMSHKYVALRASTALHKPFNELKMITCHLGNGASLAAVDHGRCVDTTMGMTPLEGLIMGTRSGDVDPGVIFHLMRERNLSPEEMESLLMKKSGLLGLSGVSSDMREVLIEADRGHSHALLAVQAFCYRIKKYVGAYWAALGGLDALVFTGGIGENAAEVRARVCQDLSGIGVVLDEAANRSPRIHAGAAVVSTEESPVTILMVPTDEERMIAREAGRALSRQEVTRLIRSTEQTIPVGVSAHHIHLSHEHVVALYGTDHQLTFKAPLTQPGQYACQEQVALVGPRGRVDRVRVLGPERKETQVEISRTEEFKLGIDAPVRMSGDLDGTPGVTLEGPAGSVTLEQGIICAKRHIHMTPEDGLRFGIRDRDVVMVEVEGERSLIFGDVTVRVNPNFKLEFHLDTDEANAAEVGTGMRAKLHSIQSRRGSGR